MKSRIITPKVGFRDEHGKITERVCFPMREVSAAEESEFWSGLAAISDADKDTKTALQFDLMVETIAGWIAEMPYTEYVDITDGDLSRDLSGDGPANAVREYFKDRTMRQERMVNAIITFHSNAQAADVVF